MNTTFARLACKNVANLSCQLTTLTLHLMSTSCTLVDLWYLYGMLVILAPITHSRSRRFMPIKLMQCGPDVEGEIGWKIQVLIFHLGRNAERTVLVQHQLTDSGVLGQLSVDGLHVSALWDPVYTIRNQDYDVDHGVAEDQVAVLLGGTASWRNGSYVSPANALMASSNSSPRS